MHEEDIIGNNENPENKETKRSVFEEDSFEQPESEDLTTSAIDKEIKELDRKINSGEVDLREALQLKEELDQKRQQIELGTEVGESIVNEIDRFESNKKQSQESEVPDYSIDKTVSEDGGSREEDDFITNERIKEFSDGIKKKEAEEDIESYLSQEFREYIDKQSNKNETLRAERAEVVSEYLGLKRDFKEKQRAYYDSLESDYKNRSVALKLFGLGRNKLSKESQKAYDEFMEANRQYHKFGEESGVYQSIFERINRENNRDNPDDDKGEKFTRLEPAVARRHVLNSAEKRLELQTLQLPERARNIKSWINEKIKTHPKAAISLAGVAFLLNPAAVTAGLATRYLGNKFYANRYERGLQSTTDSINEAFDTKTEFDFEQMEEEYFKSFQSSRRAKTVVNTAAVGAAVGFGTAFPETAYGHYENLKDVFNGSEAVPGPETAQQPESVPDQDVVSEPDASSEPDSEPEAISESEEPAPESEPETNENAIEAGEDYEVIHTVEKGESMSSILLDGIKERLNAGDLELPPGVSEENLSSFMYQSFPELTSATDVSPRLTPEQWMDLGVDSGDPHLIRPGETIDVQGMVEKLWGNELDVSPGAETDASSVTESSEPPESSTSQEATEDETTLPEMLDELMGEEAVAEADATDTEVANEGTDSTEVADEPKEPKNYENWSQVVEDMKENGAETADASESAGSTEGPNYHEVDADHAESTPELPPNEGAILNEDLANFTKEFSQFDRLHPYLTKFIEDGVARGDIILPENMMVNGVDYSRDISGYIEARFPEIKPSLFEGFLNILGANLSFEASIDTSKDDFTLLDTEIGARFDKPTALDWRRLGVSSGNPGDLSSGDNVRVGEIVSRLLNNKQYI